MTGHYRMQRGWMEHQFFGREPFTRAQAWCWLIEKAAWKGRNQSAGKDYVHVNRGEYATSVRFLAERWQWSKSRVQRFLAGLESEGMAERRVIEACSKCGTPSGTPLTVISICNYNIYQASADESGTPSGTAAGQRRDSSGTNYKKGKKDKEKNRGPYAFEGKVIKLTETDFARWEQTFKNIPNLRALLEGRDAWLSEQPEDSQKTWFRSTAAWLANRDAKAVNDRPAEGEEVDPNWRERQERAEAALKEKDDAVRGKDLEVFDGP